MQVTVCYVKNSGNEEPFSSQGQTLDLKVTWHENVRLIFWIFTVDMKIKYPGLEGLDK